MARALYRWSYVLLALLAGCAAFGGPEGKPEEDNPPKTYGSLSGHTVAIMVWVDAPTRTEYPTIQLDLAKMVRDRLQEKMKPEEEKKKNPPPPTRFIEPASVVRFQREHPGIEATPIEQVAPRLSVERVVYVELERFETQSPRSVMLLKGSARASLRIVEVVNRKATVVLEEVGIKADYPPHAPEGVMASDQYNIRSVYDGTLSLLADRLANRFDRPN